MSIFSKYSDSRHYIWFNSVEKSLTVFVFRLIWTSCIIQSYKNYLNGNYFQDHPTSPSAAMSSPEPSTPSQSGSRRRRIRGASIDPVTSSPGRDLPSFEDESDLLGNENPVEEEDGEELFGDNLEK